MNNIQRQAIKDIEAMSDREVIIAVALATAEIYGQIPEHWRRVAEIYGAQGFSDYETNDMVEDELGDEYCLDPELCREWLITEATKEK